MEELSVNGFTFSAARIPLPTSAILVIEGKRGILGCGYLSIDTADKLGHALAVVTGVSTYDDMLEAEVKKVSAAAEALGVKVGMSGRTALLLMEHGPAVSLAATIHSAELHDKQ